MFRETEFVFIIIIKLCTPLSLVLTTFKNINIVLFIYNFNNDRQDIICLIITTIIFDKKDFHVIRFDITNNVKFPVGKGSVTPTDIRITCLVALPVVLVLQ